MFAENPTDFPPLQLDDTSPEATVHALVERAAELTASDLYLETNEASVQASVRHLGLIRKLNKFSADHGQHLINHVKAAAGMDIAERRRPLNGRWIYETKQGSKLDLRISAIPTLFGEDLGIRLLDRDSSLRRLDQLGMLQSETNQISSMLANPSGLILVTGPTGSGKTTTLYACIKHLCDGRRKINTLEDPIEYFIDGVRQSQINRKIGVDYPDLLTNVLRQAPDVIMIGEIRDSQTAQIAVRAANSGHLVLATLHAPIAAAGLQSMQALDVHRHFLSSSLLGIVSQRLVRVLCDDCKVEIPLDEAPETFAEIRPWLKEGEGKRMFGPGQCDACHHTGYTQRIGVFEIMGVSPRMRKLIVKSQPARDVERAAIEDGMLELRRSALLRVAQGITSTEEVFRVVPTEYLTDEY